MSLFGNIGLRGNKDGDNEAAPKTKKGWQALNNEEEKKEAEPSYWESIKTKASQATGATSNYANSWYE